MTENEQESKDGRAFQEGGSVCMGRAALRRKDAYKLSPLCHEASRQSQCQGNGNDTQPLVRNSSKPTC